MKRSSRDSDSTTVVLTGVGIAIALVGVIVAVLAWWFPVGQSEPTGRPPGAVTTAPAEDTVAEPSSTSSEPTDVDEPTEAAPSISAITDLSAVELEVERASNGFGRQVGDQLYELSAESTTPILQLDIEWQRYDRDGVAMNEDECQIVVTVSGPGATQERRFGACDGRARGWFDGWPRPIEASGDWRVEIRDEVAGVAHFVDLTVLPPNP